MRVLACRHDRVHRPQHSHSRRRLRQRPADGPEDRCQGGEFIFRVMNGEVLDVLISNAGIVSGKPLHEIPDEEN